MPVPYHPYSAGPSREIKTLHSNKVWRSKRATSGVLDMADNFEMRRGLDGMPPPGRRRPGFRVAHGCARISSWLLNRNLRRLMPQNMKLLHRDNRFYIVFAYSVTTCFA